MKTIDDTTIGKYRKSDSGDRIFLFLEHRDLRSEFLTIDMVEAKINRDPAAKNHGSGIADSRGWFPTKKH